MGKFEIKILRKLYRAVNKVAASRKRRNEKVNTSSLDITIISEDEDQTEEELVMLNKALSPCKVSLFIKIDGKIKVGRPRLISVWSGERWDAERAEVRDWKEDGYDGQTRLMRPPSADQHPTWVAVLLMTMTLNRASDGELSVQWSPVFYVTVF